MQARFQTSDEHDEELKLLRKIATLAYQYSRTKMHEDSLNMQALAKEWHKKYGRKKNV